MSCPCPSPSIQYAASPSAERVLPRRPSRLGRVWWVILFLALAAAIIVPSSALSGGVENLIYRGQQTVRRYFLIRGFERDSGHAAVLESEHFVLYYDSALDADWAALVLDSAEDARAVVLARLQSAAPADSPDRIPLLLYPDEAALDRQFASSPEGFRALGAYWCGVIQVLSPRLWLSATPLPGTKLAFESTGPLVHEYTHYLLDVLVPGGMYPRWLSEGLAQYVEYRGTGYMWLEADNVINVPIEPPSIYRLAELEQSFDDLENMALAYREAFLLVAYLEDGGPPSLMDGILGEMAHGRSFGAALQTESGMSMSSLEENWLLWLEQNLARFS